MHPWCRARIIPVMDRVLSPYLRGGGAQAFNFSALSQDLLAVTLEIPFSVPPYMSLIARSVVTLEGIALTGARQRTVCMRECACWVWREVPLCVTLIVRGITIPGRWMQWPFGMQWLTWGGRVVPQVNCDSRSRLCLEDCQAADGCHRRKWTPKRCPGWDPPPRCPGWVAGGVGKEREGGLTGEACTACVHRASSAGRVRQVTFPLCGCSRWVCTAGCVCTVHRVCCMVHSSLCVLSAECLVHSAQQAALK